MALKPTPTNSKNTNQPMKAINPIRYTAYEISTVKSVSPVLQFSLSDALSNEYSTPPESWSVFISQSRLYIGISALDRVA